MCSLFFFFHHALVNSCASQAVFFIECRVCIDRRVIKALSRYIQNRGACLREEMRLGENIIRDLTLLFFFLIFFYSIDDTIILFLFFSFFTKQWFSNSDGSRKIFLYDEDYFLSIFFFKYNFTWCFLYDTIGSDYVKYYGEIFFHTTFLNYESF